MSKTYSIPAEQNNLLDNDPYDAYKADVYASQTIPDDDQNKYFTTRISVYDPVERREVTYDGPKIRAANFEQAQLLLDLGSKKVFGRFIPGNL